MVRLIGGVCAVAAVVAIPVAAASNKIASGVRDVTIEVAPSSKTAVVSYRSHGRIGFVRACCALNARFPSPSSRQVKFRLNYGAGPLRRSSCRRYDGPALPYVVAACRAPDGSYWVAQSWPRNLPNLGLRPSRVQKEWDLRLSHFRGELPVLRVGQDWAYGGRFDHLYGALTYLGHPQHGFSTNRAGNPLDRFGVLIYVDTYNSAYGKGWRRENSFVTHAWTGIFCYGFFPHRGRRAGNGKAYRVTAAGPGVLPDLVWQRTARGRYHRLADLTANLEQSRRFSDRLCRPN